MKTYDVLRELKSIEQNIQCSIVDRTTQATQANEDDAISYYLNGNIKTFTQNNFIKHGLYIAGYESGSVKSVCYYNMGVLNGRYNSYYESGDSQYELTYENGVIVGAFIFNEENGTTHLLDSDDFNGF
jgi:antitoxin component YwqK of YwqJK toxin-antitoxin module